MLMEGWEEHQNLPRTRKIPLVSIAVDENLLAELCVKMVTWGGLPFNSLDQPGLKDLLQIHTNALKLPFRRVIEQNNVKVPVLDNETRWNSGFLMLDYFVKNEEFLRELIDGNDLVQLSEEDWQFLKEYCTVFEPVYCATVRLQNESLTMGDFFFIWLDCLMTVEEIANSQMASTLVAAMKNRQTLLVEGKPFLAALYLDPRINYVQSDLMSDEQKKIGLQHLLQLWSKMRTRESHGGELSSVPSSRQS
ncbi:uncharacterized protein LOC126576706 [Anopheles aquasalis]|uniref:uncharacterized protein LOC126576706 n=1 Tax=Anopheles aquasalis TaxID=42839 RepID=UPI00215A3CBB|nr:uncharacterized protein LOC126576706 [Anopheles aquasalis]